MTINNKSLITFLLASIFLLSNCVKWNPVSSKEVPTNALERARKNIDEGRGVSVKSILGGGRGTNYEFSTSNPMWRATLDTLDFIPFSTVDYSGGLVITDWYSDGADQNQSIKITVRFLSNMIQSNSLKITVHQRTCLNQNTCTTKIVQSKIEEELQKSIIRTAAILEKKGKAKK
jgi:hypothetical protein|tara:strand:+ start:243 stop:767 length:525 start_codon:yes stop_codon:yes gene_type:complete